VVRGAREHNLAGFDCPFPVGLLTVVAGPERRLWNPRSTVGTATELSYHLCVLLAFAGARQCPRCGGEQRRHGPSPATPWRCGGCGSEGAGATPAESSPSTYEAACPHCHGIGTISSPRVDRLVVRPDQPICGGALHSPGFYPQSYLCRPEHGGYWMLQALGQRYGFDPATTPWSKLSQAAQEAFLFGEEQVELAPEASRMASRTVLWRGIYRVVSGWDIGGQYTEQVPCPVCDGTRLRPEHLEVSLAGLHRHHLHQRSVAEVGQALATVPEPVPVPGWARCSFAVARRRLGFLRRIGLGYLHLDRLCTTLSAGEVQRVKLTSLLGSDLTGMTVLLDEPSRGMHPSEVAELAAALGELRDAVTRWSRSTTTRR
jgi:excinuclease ABC subunit A